MQIQITNVGTPFKDGKYFKLELAYTRDGKPNTRKLVNIGPVFDVLKGAQPGENYEVDLVQDPKTEYWNWQAARKILGDYPANDSTGTAPVSTTRGAVSKSTYETPVERAARQVLIVRQSSLSNAIEFLSREKPSI